MQHETYVWKNKNSTRRERNEMYYGQSVNLSYSTIKKQNTMKRLGRRLMSRGDKFKLKRFFYRKQDETI